MDRLESVPLASGTRRDMQRHGEFGWVANGNVMAGTQGWGDCDAPLITYICVALW